MGDRRKCQTYAASPAEPGGLPDMLVAYNACDGNTPQVEIARKSKLDKGALSRLLARWIEAGVMIRIGEDQFPLHIYQLTEEALEQSEE
jgi:DNA-binding MarR family transcriptional regulator